VNITNTVTDAAYRLVHEYPGGAQSLAPRIGIASPRVLDNKVNPNSAHHKLTLDEAVAATDMSGDLRVLQAWAAHCGQLLVPVFDGLASDEALLDTYTTLIRELGEFSGVFHDAIADGEITRREFDLMKAELHDFFTAGESLLLRAEQLVVDQ